MQNIANCTKSTKVDIDLKQAEKNQQESNWHRENNYAGNNLAWQAASATGSRTYMGHHHTGVHPSDTKGKECDYTTFANNRIIVQTHLA